MRMQLVPLPRMNPRQPSSRHILASALPTLSLYASRPALCTWKRILRRSSGETTVRETAPATPPAQKAATTGWETKACSFKTRSEVGGRTGAVVEGAGEVSVAG
jgi:hypothetical protein